MDVASEDMEQPLLCRTLLEALGLDTREILEAACDKFGKDVSADELITGQDYAPGIVAKFLTAGVNHSDHALAEDADEVNSSDLLDEGTWLDLGEYSPKERNNSLRKLLSESVNKVLSKETFTTQIQGCLRSAPR